MINVQFGFRRLNTELIRGLKLNKDWKFSKILSFRFRKKFKSSDIRKSFFQTHQSQKFQARIGVLCLALRIGKNKPKSN